MSNSPIIYGPTGSKFIGNPQGGSGTVLTNDGTGNLFFSPAPTTSSASYQLTNLGLQWSSLAGAATFTLTQMDGSTAPTSGSPVSIGYKTLSGTQAGYLIDSISTTRSVTVPSGSTLGSQSGIFSTFWIYGIWDGSASHIGISHVQYNDEFPQPITQLVGSDNSNSLLYSDFSSGGADIKLIGKFIHQSVTAGIWITADPSALVLPTLYDIEAVAAAYTVTGSPSVAAGASPLLATYNTVQYDTHGSYSAGIYTFPKSGKYLISADLSFAVIAALTDAAAFISIVATSGSFSAYSRTFSSVGSPTFNDTVSISRVITANSGDTMQINFWQNNRGASALNAVDGNLSISWISQ